MQEVCVSGKEEGKMLNSFDNKIAFDIARIRSMELTTANEEHAYAGLHIRFDDGYTIWVRTECLESTHPELFRFFSNPGDVEYPRPRE